MAVRSLIAIVTPAFGSPESVEFLKREATASGDGAIDEIRLIAPAVETNTFHHTLGDIDEPRVHAKECLERALAAAQAAGVTVAEAEVGDADPVQAAQDALLQKPADEVLIFSHTDSAKIWYEGGLWKHAESDLEPELKLVVVDGGPEGNEHIVRTETSTAGCSDHEAAHEVGSAYLPGLSRGDLAGILLGIIGTITVVILAAAATAGNRAIGWSAVAIGIAIAVALVNMANVVGQLLMEAVHYRGGFAKMFRDIAVIGTPVALLINLAILIFA